MGCCTASVVLGSLSFRSVVLLNEFYAPFVGTLLKKYRRHTTKVHDAKPCNGIPRNCFINSAGLNVS